MFHKAVQAAMDMAKSGLTASKFPIGSNVRVIKGEHKGLRAVVLKHSKSMLDIDLVEVKSAYNEFKCFYPNELEAIT